MMPPPGAAGQRGTPWRAVAPASSRPPAWYAVAWCLALPVVAGYLLWRSLRQPEYRQHWRERFLGRGGPPAAIPAGFWIHAVSLGETRAARPLIEQLAQRHPAAGFLLTHMTPTGRAAGAEIAQALPGRVTQRYLPYDLPFAVTRFLREVQPQVGVLMETEIWPALLHAAHREGVPMVLANARLSRRSLDKALRLRALMRRAAGAISVIGAQTEADRARFTQVYDGPVAVTGNAKFDMTPDPAQCARGRAWRAALEARFGARPLWLFASTREGEEALLLAALARIGPATASAPLCLFVPRHPQRFAEVAALLRRSGAGLLQRSELAALGGDPGGPAAAAAPGVAPGGLPFLLGDSLGEMPVYYAMADAAFIGGSLLPLGGQNLIEACACACPVVMGPHMFNFAAAADDAVAAGAARRAADADAALQALHAITGDAALRAHMQSAARAFAAAHRGATVRTAVLIETALAGGAYDTSAAAGD